MREVVAIDGPAGAGKSTLAKMLAKKLGYSHIDTGAMYRAVTWLALKKGIPLDEENKLAQLAQEMEIYFQPPGEDGISPVIVNGQDVTREIRQAIIDQNVSKVASLKKVRDILVNLQRKIAKQGKIVMDGRDIATRVLPEADLKLFITASLEERARRRYQDFQTEEKSLAEIKKEIALRDKIDSEREYSPLRKAADAILIDTTHLSTTEVLAKVLKLVEQGGQNGK